MRGTFRTLGLLLLVTAIARSQSASEKGGRIFFADKNGQQKAITNGNLDAEPSLSFDQRRIVFVRRTPGDTVEVGLGEVAKNELWIATVDGSEPPRRVLRGGEFIDGPNIAAGEVGNPQFSPDAKRIYFTAAAWVTSRAVLVIDVATGATKFLFAGEMNVIQSGKYRGYLIASR